MLNKRNKDRKGDTQLGLCTGVEFHRSVLTEKLMLRMHWACGVKEAAENMVVTRSHHPPWLTGGRTLQQQMEIVLRLNETCLTT